MFPFVETVPVIVKFPENVPFVFASAALALVKAAIEIVLAPAIVTEAKLFAPVPTEEFAPAIVAEAKALAPAPTAVLAPF